jgi:SAM-dependent methyltransferase
MRATEMIVNILMRALARGLRDPIAEVRRQYWNVRDFLFVRKVGEHYFYRGERYPAYLAQGNAAQFIRDEALKYCRGRGLDIGAGEWPLDGAIPVENSHAANAYNLSAFDDNSLDYIFSSHCLEHLTRWEEALALWIQKIKVGGILFLYLPHESMKMWRPGGPWVRDHHVWIPTAQQLIPFLENCGMSILDHNPGRDHAWSFHLVAKKIENTGGN